MPKLTAAELQALLVRNLPPVDHHDEIIEQLSGGQLRIRLPFRKEYLGTRESSPGLPPSLEPI